MAEKDKGFRFRNLFIREDQQASTGKPDQPKVTSGKTGQDGYIPSASLSAQDLPLVEDFVQRLQNLINQNNQPGFDFLEFTESLFEEKQDPTPEVYKTVFRIAQKIDKSLTPARLLESSMFYKDLVQRTAEAEINKGTAKKQSLQGEKDTERTNLDNSLKSTRTKIQQLNKQIQELQNQEVTLSNQLSAIDMKYENQFSDIEKKVNAIRDAREKVLVSIVDIEAGIKTNIS
jgi:chromosome segregation ATPase